MEDINNIKFNMFNLLKPMRKRGSKRKFKLFISQRLSNRLRAGGLNGRFRDAFYLIAELNLPHERAIDNGACIISRIQARLSNPRKLDNFKSKPAITFFFNFKI